MRTLPRWLALIAVVVGLCGCADLGAQKGIQSAEPGQRILAIRAAGEARDQSAVPLLIDRLSDEDVAVRFYAILALDRITGTRMGYDYGGTLASRREAMARWREAMNSGTFARATSQPAGDRPVTTSDGEGMRPTE